MSGQARVLVVGAGPAGLTLGAELARSGVACTVVDKRQKPSTRSRAFGLQPVTLELLDARGLSERMLEEGIAWSAAPVGDGVRWLPFDDLRTRFPYMLIIPQTDTERVLTEWALDSGVTLRRGVTLERLTDTGDEVLAGLRADGAEAEEETRWDYVVGCDGVRSAVRTLAGIGFHGRDYPNSLVVADVRLSRPPAEKVVGLSVPRGMIALFPFPDGTYRVVVEDNLRMSVPVEEPVSQAELLDSMHAVLGGDYGLSEIIWASRYRSQQRQADTYRRGRVLLAGDAGHTHIPSGGQGLQLGIADAVNLGWKLAAVAAGRAGDALLDTYQEERWPLAAGILRKTDLLFRFNTASSPPARTLRWIGVKAATLPFVRSQVVRELSGLDVVYPSMRRRGDHALVGRRYPDTHVTGTTTGEAVRMAEMLRAGRAVLIDGGGPAVRAAAPDWADRVEVCVPCGPQPLPPGASALIRPDGFTCWIGRDPGGLTAALRRWCGSSAAQPERALVDRRVLLSLGAGTAAAMIGHGTAPAVARGHDSAGLPARGHDPAGPRAGGRDWAGLRARLRGTLVLPSDAGYDRARVLALAQYDVIRPAAIAYCASPDDVRACVAFAREHGVATAVRSGGHNYAGWSTGRGLVVDVSRLDHVRPSAAAVRLGPGAQSVDVAARLAPHDLQVVTGLCPTVCPGGYLLGGGIGWQTRAFGLGSDRLVSAEIVLADGRLLRCSAEREPELFWAMRGGGGGNFGIVTDFEVLPTRVPRMAGFALTWPWERAATVLDAWQEWIAAGPPELASSAGVLLSDARPGAVPSVLVQGARLTGRAGLDAELAALFAEIGTPPLTREVTDLPYAQAMMRWYGCADKSAEQCHRIGFNPHAQLPRQQFVIDRSRMFDAPLRGAGLTGALAAFEAGRRAGQFRYLGFFALGGAANRVPAGATAYVHRSALFFTGYTVALNVPVPDEEERAAAVAWVDRGFAAVDPHSSGGSYVNFPDPSLKHGQRAYYGANYERLRQVKRRYDPHGFFSFAQSVER